MEVRVADIVRVRLLGGFAASLGERQVPASGWRLRKAKTLVKLLALAPGHAMHVEQVADVLWGEHDGAAARNNLHQALYVARRALSSLGVDGAAVLSLHDDLLMLGRGVEVAVDIDELRTAVSAADAAGDTDRAAALLRDSSAELLPEDAYEPWLQPHAVAFREWRTQAVLDVGDRQIAAGSADTAAVLLTPVVAVEPLNEPAVRALMRALAASGRRSEALVLYERTRAALRDELGADPEPATHAAFRELLTGSSPTVPTSPPAAATQALRGNLPAATSALIGRARELDEVTTTAARTRLLTLTGMGGVGKTSLALSLARRIAGDYADGAYLVELASVHDSDQVAPRLARAMQLALPSDSSPVDAVVMQLRTRNVLIVLDNCEHLLDACAALVSELLRGCPRLRVIATSREPLRVAGEVSWRTPSLALPDPACDDRAELARSASVQLFVERAAAALPGFRLTDENADALSAICHRLDGIPLALELAAACVPMLAPEQIAARLGDAIALLRHGDRALTRQQTLEATLTWSHDLLAHDEQTLFRRIGVFAGSFTLDAVEAICADGLSGDAVLSALARLVDTSLVSVDLRGEAARYRLLDTVRQYAALRLRSSGELADIERRRCDWYVAFAVARDPELVPVATTAPANLDAEHDNLRAALSWALHHDPPVALQLTVALWRYWLARGYLAEGRRWLEAALAAVPDPSPDRARALMGLAAFDVRRGRGERLRSLGAEAVGIQRSLRDLGGLAQALCAEAVISFMLGRWDECWRRAVESRELATRCGALGVEVNATHVQGVLRSAQGRLDEARAAFDEARAMLSWIGDMSLPFLRPLSQGFAVETDARGEVRVHFEETVLHGRIVGVQQAEAHLLCNLSDVARAAGDLDAALECVRRAEAAFAAIADADGEAVALNRRGCLHRVRGEHVAAREALTRSLRLRRLSGERRAIALTRTSLGLIQAAEGDVAGGRRVVENEIARARDIQDVAGEFGMSLTLASIEAADRDDEAADAHVRMLVPPMASIPGCFRPLPWALLMHGAILDHLGDTAGAAGARAEARRRFTVLGIVDGLAALDRAAAHCN